MRTGTAGTIVLSTSRSSRCRVGSEAQESQGSFWSLPGPGPGGPGGPGVGVGQLGGGTSATAHSKDARSAVRGARACKTFLPVRSPLWHAVSRRWRSTLGSRSPCVRTARSHLPRILNRERTVPALRRGVAGHRSAVAGSPSASTCEGLVSLAGSTVWSKRRRNGCKSLLRGIP